MAPTFSRSYSADLFVNSYWLVLGSCLRDSHCVRPLSARQGLCDHSLLRSIYSKDQERKDDGDFSKEIKVLFIIVIFIILHLFIVWVYGCARMRTPQHSCGSQRTTCESRFSSSILWVPGNELRLPGLVVSAFNYRALVMA